MHSCGPCFPMYAGEMRGDRSEGGGAALGDGGTPRCWQVVRAILRQTLASALATQGRTSCCDTWACSGACSPHHCTQHTTIPVCAAIDKRWLADRTVSCMCWTLTTADRTVQWSTHFTPYRQLLQRSLPALERASGLYKHSVVQLYTIFMCVGICPEARR
jgi:hypothetical protein